MPTPIFSTRVPPAWVDYNGHMNDAEYARVFSLALEELMVRIGLDAAGRQAHRTTIYTLETHLCYLAEVHEGEPLRASVSILDRDAKRVHLFLQLYRADDTLIATSEQMLMAMGTDSGRPVALPASVVAALEQVEHLEPGAWPPQAGRRVGLRRRPG